MKQFFTLAGALALGAGAMYYLDPQQGRRRRALVGDKVDSISHDAADYLRGRKKRAADRVRGMAARVRSRFSARQPGDPQLYGRIRSRLGRVVSYPHAVHTDVREGRVLLRGDILEGEVNALMAELWSIRGVKAIDSQLDIHPGPGNVPALQGRPHRTRRARVRHYARNGAILVAIAGGLLGILRALRSEGGAAGLLSLAAAFLALGLGDGARRLVRRRRSTVNNLRARPGEVRVEPLPTERREEELPALTRPGAAFH